MGSGYSSGGNCGSCDCFKCGDCCSCGNCCTCSGGGSGDCCCLSSLCKCDGCCSSSSACCECCACSGGGSGGSSGCCRDCCTSCCDDCCQCNSCECDGACWAGCCSCAACFGVGGCCDQCGDCTPYSSRINECCIDPGNSIETVFCCPCVMERQFAAIDNFQNGLPVPPTPVGPWCCLSLSGGALCVACYLRHRVNQTFNILDCEQYCCFGIDGEFYMCHLGLPLLVFLCPFCSVCQTWRELQHRLEVGPDGWCSHADGRLMLNGMAGPAIVTMGAGGPAIYGGGVGNNTMAGASPAGRGRNSPYAAATTRRKVSSSSSDGDNDGTKERGVAGEEPVFDDVVTGVPPPPAMNPNFNRQHSEMQ